MEQVIISKFFDEIDLGKFLDRIEEKDQVFYITVDIEDAVELRHDRRKIYLLGGARISPVISQ